MAFDFKSLLGGSAIGMGSGVTNAPSGLPNGFTTKPVGVANAKTLGVATADLGMTSDITVINGQWNTLGTYTIPAQNFATFGQGNTTLDPVNQGRWYCDIKNCAGTVIKGNVRLILANNSLGTQYQVAVENVAKLNQNSTDMTKWVALSEYAVKGSENSKLILQFNPDGTAGSTQTVGITAQGAVYIPITQYL